MHDCHVSAAAHEDHRACPMGRERNRTQITRSRGTKSGDRVGIWVDSASQLVEEPARRPVPLRCGPAALGLLVERRRGCGRASAGAHWAILIRVRNASWQHDTDSLFCTAVITGSGNQGSAKLDRDRTLDGMAVESSMLALGTPAPSFTVSSRRPAPRSASTSSRPALVVAPLLIRNHCPYANTSPPDWPRSAGTRRSRRPDVGISSNDVVTTAGRPIRCSVEARPPRP